MFAKLHLLSQDLPEGSDRFRWRAHPYLRIAGTVPKGPVVFEWSARQRSDLEALWRDPARDGARERLAKDLAMFCDKLGWAPDPEQLEDAEHCGDEYMLTVSAVPSELYLLPWEVVQVGAAGTYLSDFANAQVRYAMPGLGPREVQTAPPAPGVLFAWSGAGGAVPHEEQAAAIREAVAAGGATFRELAEVEEASLAAALDDRPPSVLHLLCHGLPGDEGEPSRLSWGASDRPSEITATRLARVLRRHEDAIRLVVLSACGTGDGHSDPLWMNSLAQELHKKGIPSVVASRYPLSVRGSCVMTRVLYDKLLREAWSLERALRSTRQALLGADGDEAAYPGDAYGIQLYTHDTERFVSDNRVEADRPVLASYPFGTAARPVPAKGPPSVELTVRLERDSEIHEDELVDQLRRASEDAGLTVTTRSPAARGASSLTVQTTVDGGQRLLQAWRSKTLRGAAGAIIAKLIVTKGIHLALGGTVSTASTKVAVAAAGHIGTAVHSTAPALGSGAAATGGNVAAAGATTALAGKAVAGKVGVVALLGSMAVAAAVVYRDASQAQSAAQVQLADLADASTPPPAGTMSASGPRPAAWPPLSVPLEPPAEPQLSSPALSARPVDPVEPEPLSVAPVQPTPVQPTPVQPTPVQPTPVQSTPVQSTPVQRKPVEPTPVEPTPAGPTPRRRASAITDSGCTGRCGATAPVCGNGSTEAGEQCDDGNTKDGDGCSSRCRTEVRRTSRASRERIDSAVEQRLSISDHGHRISGETLIFPDQPTLRRLVEDGVPNLEGTVQVCIAATGSVTEAKMVASTGYAGYDKLLLEAVEAWTYRPSEGSSTSDPECREVRFTYKLERRHKRE